MDFELLKKSAEKRAKEQGVSEYELYFREDDSVSATAMGSEINQFSSSGSSGICFRCIVGDKMGYAFTELFEADEMENLVDRAVENARVIECDDEVFIYAGSEKYEAFEKSEMEIPSASELSKKTLSCQKALYDCDERVSDGTESGVVAAKTRIKIVNSKGLDLQNESGFFALYAQPVVREGEDVNTEFNVEVKPIDKIDEKSLAEKTVKESIERLGATKVKSGKYNIVFDGTQMRNILSTFASVFSGKSARLGLSLLKGKTGEIIASDVVTLTDDPFSSESPMRTNFDAEGVATYKKHIIEKGKLNTLLYNLSSAKADGVESTGNASKASYASSVGTSPYLFHFEAGEKTLDELFAEIGEGIYVTEMKGFHAGANAVTGDFSIESAGFMIRDGKKAEAVKEFTVSGNFFELLKQIKAFSNEVKYGIPSDFTMFGSPDALVSDMSVAGE